ncbi:MAG TPA: diacylglycerol kinase family protein [Actinomycetota bacterium]|nr:diacylglycerol kinase family protein [Actinomycetota bacterium]
MKVLLVGNPAAGGSEKQDRGEIVDALASLGTVEVVEPSSAERFGEEVAAAAVDAELVVAAGGDGTFNCTINALQRRLSELVFALLPMGTGNDLARTIGLGDDPVAVARGLVDGTERGLDVGHASGSGAERLFVNACMGGFPVQVNEALDDDEKERLGAAAFIWGGAKALNDLERTTVSLDDRRVPDCVAVGVGNGKTCGGGIAVWPDADPGDGRLEGCALPAGGPGALVKLAAKLKLGDHRTIDGVTVSSGPSISIDSDPPIELNVDGELIGLKTPARFEVVNRTRLLVPNRA